MPNEQQFCGQKCVVGVSSLRRTARLLSADTKATVTRYNHGRSRGAFLNAQHVKPRTTLD